MSVSEFNQATMGETLDYINSRVDFEKSRSQNAWSVMRWQSALMLNMISSKGKRYKPEDLFTFDDEVKEQAPKIDIKSKEAEEMFKKMEEKYLKKWQSR
jgi:hypothetical protein